MRVYELAKEVDVPSDEMLEILKDLEIEVTNHMASLSEEDAMRVRDDLGMLDDDQTQKEDKISSEAQVQSESSPEDVEEDSPEETAETEPAPQEQGAEESEMLELTGPVVVRDFAEQLGVKPNVLIGQLMKMNIFASITQKIDLKTARSLAEKHGVEVKKPKPKPKPKPEPEPEPEPPSGEAVSRSPVVAFLGHVDHGKTSLLDYIRETQVVKDESGGITQHIGAYTAEVNGSKITFLDTPGHAAFTQMRARGADLTDIVILVVAADDGVMPQTIEAIRHAKAAGVTVVVAINKIDLPGANPDRVRQQLQEHELMPEEWGGDIGCCEVSAETGAGLSELLEHIVLESEMLELNAVQDCPAMGYVIEAQKESGMGPTCAILIKHGTLKVGDAVVCGSLVGKVKALINEKGENLDSAGPSSAVKCMGLDGVPEPGDKFEVRKSEKLARQISEKRKASQQQAPDGGEGSKKMSLDDLLNQTDSGQKMKLPVVVKADVQGSVEAIKQSLMGIDTEKVDLKFILDGVGSISRNDVLLASTSNAIIIGFHVALGNGISSLAEKEGVEIRLYSVIYELIDDVKAAMKGLLAPENRKKKIGEAEVLQIFEIGNRDTIAGCMVEKGQVTSNCKVRVLRKDDLIYDGAVETLKRYQSDASSVRQGQECGIKLDNFSDINKGDRLEFYNIEQVEQEL